jgi:hypothetical protein
LSEYQKALWMIDEIETRWQFFLKEYRFIEYVDLYWGKSPSATVGNNSLEAAAYHISKILNINNTRLILPHLKMHANVSNIAISNELQQYIQQDFLYQNIMKKS